MAVADLLVVALAFVLVNGVFVAAEFALIGAPRTAIEHRAAQGDHLAARLLDILSSPRQQDRYIATAQLGITVASLGLGMYCEQALAAMVTPYMGRIPLIGAAALSSVLALGALTLLHIVFGEMVPKTVALQRAEGVARLAYWPMRTTLVFLYPLVTLSTAVAGVCLRLLGVRRRPNVHEQFHTPEELQLIVEDSELGGALRADAGRLLRELFEFGDLTAGQVMMPRVAVVGLPLGASPKAVRRLLAEHRHTRYPVFDRDLDHIVGMLHVKDLLRHLMLEEPITTSDVRPLPVVPETAPLDSVLTTMQRAHAHMAVVIDEHGGTAGLVSLENLLEEVVGEIDDGASESPELVPEAAGSVRAAGTVRLEELGQHFDVDLEHEDVDSVSGLVLARLGRPPVVGDRVDYGRIRLEVLATTGRGVREVRASLLPAERGDVGE
jgi:CBS domain containing-hemolysin-like protein